jgi:hypothetical protein
VKRKLDRKDSGDYEPIITNEHVIAGLRDEPDGPREMNPRAWIVTKQGMTGDLYEALAWNNDGKPLGVSITTPTPLYEGEALRAKLTKLDDLLAVIHRDGGHYQAEHGTAKAIEDAIAAVHALRAANGDLRDELEAFQASNDIRGAEVDRLRAENARLLAANRDLQAWFDAARGQSARFGDALHAIVNRCEGTARRIASGSLASSEGMPSKESDK